MGPGARSSAGSPRSSSDDAPAARRVSEGSLRRPRAPTGSGFHRSRPGFGRVGRPARDIAASNRRCVMRGRRSLPQAARPPARGLSEAALASWLHRRQRSFATTPSGHYDRHGAARRVPPGPRLPEAHGRAYIGGVRTCSDYGDKRACNKRTGPGCDSRRLHQFLPPSRYRRGLWGPISIDRRLKA